MANTVPKKIPALPAITSVSANDYLVVEHDPLGIPTTSRVTFQNFFGMVSVPVGLSANLTFTGSTYVTANNFGAANVTVNYKSTPVTSGDAANQGRIWFDNNYIYVAISNNVIKRAALSTF